MRSIAVFLSITFITALSISAQSSEIPNPAIDMTSFLRISRDAAEHRRSRRLTEEQFIKAMREEGVVILDARSRQRFDELHIKGAVNLSFPDITVESLARVLPDKNTKILIYCNNNFQGAEQPFPTKMAPASLNLSTYISLITYGYKNVYELGPLLDVTKTKLELVSGADGE